ncbi:MAG: FKBP-type peptidyl-prolyl cis-trans isomerase [Bacteroidales bacterium]|nr:FKBP-type peptidyl-prolyl cis-trans isomerase [Bacteroidales bacterium]
MKKHILIPIAVATVVMLASCGTKAEHVKLNNQQDTLSWAMGMSLAETAMSNFYQFDQDIVLQAFKSRMKGDKQPLGMQDYQDACQYLAMLASLQSRQNDQVQQQNADKQQAELFARLQSEKPSLTKAPEGYYYEVIRPGHGPVATVGKRIKFDFKGINMVTGETIEETYGHRDPVVHVLGRPMFEGLLLGMQLMNAGSKFRFYFPHQLVTGANGIPPYTPVIYEVELHEIYNN